VGVRELDEGELMLGQQLISIGCTRVCDGAMIVLRVKSNLPSVIY